MEKKCIRCNKTKPLAVFAEFQQRGRSYRHSQCNQCRNARSAETVRRDRNGVLLRGTPEAVAARLTEIAGHRPVVVIKVGASYRAINANAFVGIYDAGCDYRDVLREIAA